jgi:hypothetical protein
LRLNFIFIHFNHAFHSFCSLLWLAGRHYNGNGYAP